MRCPICGEQIKKDMKFCAGCGSPVQSIRYKEEPTTLQCTCKNCGGMMNYDREQFVLTCPFCGAKEIVIEDEDVTIQRIKSEAYKEVELKKLEHREKEKQQAAEQIRAKKYTRGCLGIFTIVFGVFCLLLGLAAIIAEDPLSGVIALIQGALFLVSWFMARGKLKASKISYAVPLIVGLVLVVPFCALFTKSTESSRHRTPDSDYTWPVGTIAEAIPQPEGEYGTVYYQSEESFSMDVYMDSTSDFTDYVNACKEAGFTVDVSASERSFNAYNEEGYHLDLYYFSSEDYMSLSLEAPIKMSTLHWPNSDLGKLLPIPKSDYGYVAWENSDGFDVYVGKTSMDDFEDYVAACQEAGFTVDYSKGKGYFNADDEDGNSLSIYYEGNMTMQIHLYGADD